MPDPKPLVTTYVDLLWQSAPLTAPSVGRTNIYIDNTGIIYAHQSDDELQEIFRGGTHVNSKGQYNGLISNMPDNNDFAIDLKASASPTVPVLRVKNSSNISQIELSHLGRVKAKSVQLDGATTGSVSLLSAPSVSVPYSIILPSAKPTVDGQVMTYNIDGSTAFTTVGGGAIGGSGTTGYIPYFSGATTLADSPLAINAGNIGLGSVTPTHKFEILLGTITSAISGLYTTATWNNGGVSFNHILVDITNTASASTSNFVNLKIGGSTKFRIDYNGNTFISAQTLIADFATNGSIGRSTSTDLTTVSLWWDGSNTVLNANTGAGIFFRLGNATQYLLMANGINSFTQPVDISGTGYVWSNIQMGISSTSTNLLLKRTGTSLLQVRNGNDSAWGNIESGNISLNPDGSSTGTSARTLTIGGSSFSSGEALRLIIGGGEWDSFYTEYGKRTLYSGYYGLEMRAGKEDITLLFPNNGTANDPTLTIYPGKTVNVGLVIKCLSSQTQDLLQFHSSGGTSLAGFTATGALSFTQGTITASTPFLTQTGTWNSSGTTFVNFLSNVTDTASAAGSLLFDFQIGGVSKGKLDKTGLLTVGSILTSSSTGPQIDITSSNVAYLRLFGVGDSSNFTAIELKSDETTDKAWNILHRKTSGQVNDFLIEEYNGSTFTERLRIKPGGTFSFNGTISGNIILNTTTGNALDISSAASDLIKLKITATNIHNTIAFYNSSNTFVGSFGYGGSTASPFGDTFFLSVAAKPLKISFNNGSNYKVHINSSGNVAIGSDIATANCLLSLATTGIADANIPLQLSTAGNNTESGLGINKNGAYALILSYQEARTLGSFTFSGAYLRNCTSEPIAIVVNSTTFSTLWDASGNVFLGGSITSNAGASARVKINTSGNVDITTSGALLTFGGVTSSFPALDNSGAGLRVRLADGSGFSSLESKNLIVTQGTITASTPFLSHTATWNNGAVAFVNIFSNVTDTASAAGSYLLRLQRNGSDEFTVGKTGDLGVTGNIYLNGNAIYLDASNPTFWSFSRSGNSTLFTMQPNASSYWVFAESSGGTNWLNVRADAQAIGMGTASPTSFLHINQTADSTNNTTPVAFNCFSPGATGELTASSGVQIFAQFLTTVNQTSTAGFTVLKIASNRNGTGSGSNLLIDAHDNGVSVFKVDILGDAYARNLVTDDTGLVIFGDRSRITSPSDGRLTISNSIPNNFTMLSFGVDNSDSFPGIKVSGDFLGFDIRTTDDGEYANLKAGHLYADLSVEAKTIVGGRISGDTNWNGNTGIVLQANNMYYTITGNVTLNGITGGATGAWYVIIIKQDATGGRTVNWGSYVEWSGGTAPTITATANKKSIIYLLLDPDGTGKIYGRYDLNYS